MQKKYKRAIIITLITTTAITLALVLSGLAQVGLDQNGLNYNLIMANYSDTSVYGPGLYLIGLSNKFIRINKNQQSLSYSNLTTFTTDFYSLTAYLEISYLFNFTTSNSFATLTTFYQAMGDNPRDILEPLIKNEILVILSSKSSQYYQNSLLANEQIQVAIATRVQTILSTWVGSTIKVIIESLVCEGTTTNTEIIDREIQSLIHDMERASNEKVELSDYYSSLYSKAQFEILSAGVAIASKAAILQRMLQNIEGSASSLSGKNVTKTIYDNQAYNYDLNLLNILQELIMIGNRTFPY